MANKTDTAYRNQLLYSVFVRDYGRNGTFLDVEKDLDRIRSLGTDIIWLMPIHPLGVKGRKGSVGSPYAIKDYRSVNPDMGTLDDFIRLTNAIHDRGMKCIIDVVYNHTSPDSVLATEHPEWFLHDEDGNVAAKVPEWYDIVDLDYSHKELWDYQIETLRYWAQYVDGFRCDVAPFVPAEFWMMAREAVEEVRPGAFWLAESVEPEFIRISRENKDYCLTDSELYPAFDATYDYDIYGEWLKAVQSGEGFDRYLEALNRQESVYPENYIKLHFLENHDRPRLAAYVPDPVNRRHQLAFSIFQKGLAFIYNGQERSAYIHTPLFEKDPVDWSGDDMSETIRRMMTVKRKDIMASGVFEAHELRKGVVIAQYTLGGSKLIGIFRISGGPCGVCVPLPDGEYKNEYDQETVSIYEGALTIKDSPVIIQYV